MKSLCGALLILVSLLSSSVAGQSNPGVPPAKPNEQVIVTRAVSDASIRGQLLELTPDRLAMLVGTRRVELPMADVVRVDAGGIPSETARSSARWCSARGARSCVGRGVDERDQVVPVVAVNTALGALIGAGIDRLHTTWRTVFERRTAVPDADRRAAVAVRVRF